MNPKCLKKRKQQRLRTIVSFCLTCSLKHGFCHELFRKPSIPFPSRNREAEHRARYAALSEIVSGKKPGRENSKERIMSMNLGLAIEDVAMAILIHKKARKTGIGIELPL